MKKGFFKLLLIVVVALSMLLSACGQPLEQTTTDQTINNEETQKLKVIATTFPIYDWLREIIGENSETIELSLLVDNGVDLHSFQPSTQDIANISTADMFVYNGGESDFWVKEVLEQAVNQEMIAINLMDELGDELEVEELVEGMQDDDHSHAHDEDAHIHDEDDHAHDEDDHAHDEDAHTHDEDTHAHDEDDHAHDEDDHAHDEDTHAHDEDDHAHDETAHYDEHIWLSLENAEELVETLSGYLGQFDPQNAIIYQTNAQNYITKLEQLDERYEQTIEAATRDTILVADRFPFRYLVDDYDINYYATFSGCSAETEASFETIAFLANKIDELEVQNVLMIDGGNQSIPTTIINTSENSDAQVLVLDSIQSVDRDDIQNGVTYLSVMEQNLEVLKTALS